MTIQLRPKVIFIVALVVLAAGLIIVKRQQNRATTPSPQAVAACQKQVTSTYTNMLDTSSLVAPATTTGIQKEENDALAACNN